MANHGKEEGTKLIANNKKAYHDYFVDETFECGIELAGTEVKSLRLGQCSIKESFCNIKNGEVFIYGMQIRTRRATSLTRTRCATASSSSISPRSIKSSAS